MILEGPVPLRDEHVLEGFDCGKAPLNEWLLQRALSNEKRRISKTYVLHVEQRVLGYYSLNGASLQRGELPRKLRHGSPDVVPVVLLGRLAIHQSPDLRGKGYGIALAQEAVRKAVQAADLIALMLLVVDAIDDQAKTFWAKHFEMIALDEIKNPYRLFVPIETLQRGLAAIDTEIDTQSATLSTESVDSATEVQPA